MAKLKVDSAGRIFLPKDCRSILGINAEDELALTLDSESDSILIKVQRSSKIVKGWRLTEEKSY